jgi:hypothetical protein
MAVLLLLIVAIAGFVVTPQSGLGIAVPLIPIGVGMLVPFWRLSQAHPAEREERLRPLGWFAIEELVVAPLWSLGWLGGWMDRLVPAGWRWGIYLAAALVLAILPRLHLAEWLFPVRGAWLRRFAAVPAVAALFLMGPWLLFAGFSWPVFPPLTFVVAANCLLYAWAAVRVLSPLPAPEPPAVAGAVTAGMQ